MKPPQLSEEVDLLPDQEQEIMLVVCWKPHIARFYSFSKKEAENITRETWLKVAEKLKTEVDKFFPPPESEPV